mgnify:CR=1 FL=1
MKLKEKLKNIIFKIKDFLWNDVPYRYSTYLSFIHTIAWLYIIIMEPLFESFEINSTFFVTFMMLFIIPTMILFAIYIIFFILEFKIKRIKRNKFIDNRFIKNIVLISYILFIGIKLFFWVIN